MFHVERHDLWRQIAGKSPFPIPDGMVARLELYRNWLIAEAIPAGGIGPGEAERVDTRHIADSLLFSLVMEATTDVLDVGTGVGLPGLPLAMLLPSTPFTVLDRAGRRIDLARRAVRILDLDNVEVVQSDLSDWDEAAGTVVSRATIPPDEFLHSLRKLLRPGGIGVVGGSWSEEPSVPGYETKEIGSAFLDRSVWILMMRQT